MQKQPRELGRSVFVDEHLAPYADQWLRLSSIPPLSGTDLENAILRASGGRHPLDVSFASGEDENKPWQRRTTHSDKVTCPLPDSVHLVLANQIFLTKTDVPQPLANRLIRLAAFQNPEFYKAQAVRLPVWTKRQDCRFARQGRPKGEGHGGPE